MIVHYVSVLFACQYLLLLSKCSLQFRDFLSPHLTYPLTVRVSGAPQMTSQPNFPHLTLSSTALWELVNSKPVHSLLLSSHLIFCLPCLLPPFIVPCKMTVARPDEWETCPYHCTLLLFIMVTWSNCLLNLGTDFLVGNVVFVWDA